MIGFIFVVLVVILAGVIPVFIVKIENSGFSNERVFKELKKDGLSNKDAKEVLDMLKPKVGQPGLPAWESKKRNLTKEEL